MTDKDGWKRVVLEPAPTTGERVIVYDSGLGMQCMAYWCDERLRWVSAGDETQGLANITHWQPLPSDPPVSHKSE